MEDVWTTLTPVLVNFALIVIPLLGAYLTVVLKNAIKSYDEKGKVELFFAEVERVVKSLEQQGIIIDWDGIKKKEIATLALTALRDKGNIAVTDKQIDDAIEAYVLNLKDAQIIIGSDG